VGESGPGGSCAQEVESGGIFPDPLRKRVWMEEVGDTYPPLAIRTTDLLGGVSALQETG